MSLPATIGLSGCAGSGKGTLASLLVEHRGYRVAHLADGVRDALRALDPILDIWGDLPRRWSAVLNDFGYAGAKHHHSYGQEVRRLMQAMGTEVGRTMFGENCWIDALARTISPGERVAIADVRFPNEAAWIERVGGLVVRIHRPGVGPLNDHPSETSLDGIRFDIEIVNDGPPQQMLDRLLAQVAKLTEAAR